MKTANSCDKLVFNLLKDYGCQTSQQIFTFLNRLNVEDVPSTSRIGASLRKMGAVGLIASSKNDKGQRVYWVTDYGKECGL